MARFDVELFALHWLRMHCSIIIINIIVISIIMINLIFVMNILPCYFPEQLVKTVDIRFTFPRQYKAVYDDLDAEETKEFTTQIVNAVSVIFVHIVHILSSQLESDTCIKTGKIIVWERPLLFLQTKDEYKAQGLEVERVIVTKLR